MTKAAIAQKLDVSPGLISHITNGLKHGGEESIDKAKKALNLHEDYFSASGDEMGRFVSYEDYVGRTPLRHVESDSALSPYPEVEALISDELASGRAISPTHLAELRALRLHRSTSLSPYDTASLVLANLRAADRGKARPKTRVR